MYYLSCVGAQRRRALLCFSLVMGTSTVTFMMGVGGMCPDFLPLQYHVDRASSFSFSCQSPTRKVIPDERDGVVFQMKAGLSP